MTTSHPFFPLSTCQLIYRVIPVKRTCFVMSDGNNSNYFWRSWKAFENGKQKQRREYLWRPFTTSISAKGEPSFTVSNYRASGRALSHVAKFVQSNILISPELLTVLEEEATRDLYSSDFFFKIDAIISTLYPTSWNKKHWISVRNERQDLKTNDGWRNSLALECFKSFILLLRNGGSLQVLVCKKPNKPSVYKAGSIFIYHFTEPGGSNCDEKKLLSLTNKEHFNRLTSTIL